MKVTNIILIAAVLLALGIGGLYLFDSLATRAPATAAVPVTPESTVTPLVEGAPTGSNPAPAPPVGSEQTALQIERALVAADPQQRETALNNLLPELLQADPSVVVALVARQQPGETRDLLREEVTRQWITRDRAAAIEWIGSLEEPERRASATTAMRTLAANSPPQAIEVADHFGIGRDDGMLEHLVQVWANENLDEAMQWVATQPDNPQTAQLRARIEEVRDQKLAITP